jgi:hypothetical protein
MNINEIESQMINLITEDKLTSDTIKGLLLDDESVIGLIGDPYFIEKLEEIFEILTSDVDGDGKITINDLQTTLQRSLEDLETVFGDIELLLLSDNAKVGVRLVENILIVVSGIMTRKITWSVDKTRLILFKVLIYFLIEILPKGSNRNYRPETQIILIQIITKLLNSLMSMHLLSVTMNKINNLIPTVKNCFTSCCGDNKSSSKAIVQIQQRRLQQKLIADARLVGSKIAQKKKIIELQKEINVLKNNNSESGEEESINQNVINSTDVSSNDTLNNLPFNE